MASKVYIICRKCGSDDIKFIIDDPCPDDPLGFVSISCNDCSELTAINEWAEFNNKKVVDRRKR